MRSVLNNFTRASISYCYNNNLYTWLFAAGSHDKHIWTSASVQDPSLTHGVALPKTKRNKKQENLVFKCFFKECPDICNSLYCCNWYFCGLGGPGCTIHCLFQVNCCNLSLRTILPNLGFVQDHDWSKREDWLRWEHELRTQRLSFLVYSFKWVDHAIFCTLWRTPII